MVYMWTEILSHKHKPLSPFLRNALLFDPPVFLYSYVHLQINWNYSSGTFNDFPWSRKWRRIISCSWFYLITFGTVKSLSSNKLYFSTNAFKRFSLHFLPPVDFSWGQRVAWMKQRNTSWALRTDKRWVVVLLVILVAAVAFVAGWWFCIRLCLPVQYIL